MIACLGWGSLVWDPRCLPIRRSWLDDGPFVRVDFLRQSDDDRMTLVLSGEAAPVRSLWAPMVPAALEEAQAALAKRENTPIRNIGAWNQHDHDPPAIVGLAPWADAHGVEHVIWTNLPPKFNRRNNVTPTVEQVIAHLDALHGPKRAIAERYVRAAPRQIDTDYRRHIEVRLGWTAY